MELHELKEVRHTSEPHVYAAVVDITDLNGDRYETEYISRPDDTFGLAPTIRAAVREWVADLNPILPYMPPPLEKVRNQIKLQIDLDAEEVRLRYITPGAGQAMTYQQKAAEAAECLKTTNPEADDYPLLASEIGITAETLIGVAEVVYQQHQAWKVIGSHIEQVRLNSKKAVTEALTIEAIQEIYSSIEWPEY